MQRYQAKQAKSVALRRFARGAVSAVTALLLVFGLSGCKYTDVLTQYLEDPDLGITDVNIDPLFQLDVDSPPDSRVLATKADSDREDEQELTLPEYKKDAENEQQSDNTTHDDNTPEDQDAANGDEPDEGDGTHGNSKSDSGNKSSNDDTNKEATDQEGDDPDSNNTAGLGGTTTVYDASGTAAELPENVGCIAAAGQYATIVQMLGGEGGLCAVDAEWQNMVADRGVFPDEGVEDLAIGFTGSAEEGYHLDVDALVEAFSECLVSGQQGTLFYDGSLVQVSEDDLKALDAAAKEKGITIAPVIVPTLGKSDNAEDDIVSAVNIVGETLKSSQSCSLDVQAAASRYTEYYNSVIELCLNANGGKYGFKMMSGNQYQYIYKGTDSGEASSNMVYTGMYTAYIDSWTYQTKSSATADCTVSGYSFDYINGVTTNCSGGIGLSVTSTSRNFLLMDYYLQVAGVADSSFPYDRPTLTNSGVSLPYGIVAGAASAYTSGVTVSTLNTLAQSPLWFSPSTFGSGMSFVTPGTSNFPCLLVASSEYAQNVVNASTDHGVYDMGTSYTVRVVPNGVAGLWSKGTVESFLLSIWMIRSVNPSADNIKVCDDYVNGFYQTFYRCNNATTSGAVANYDNSYQAG